MSGPTVPSMSRDAVMTSWPYQNPTKPVTAIITHASFS